MKAQVKFDRMGNVTSYVLNGKEVTKEEYDIAMPNKEIGLPLAAAPSAWQDFQSVALAVHPEQVEEATARNVKHGVNVKYDTDGTAIIPDRAERKKLLKLEGMHDRQGCYGD